MTKTTETTAVETPADSTGRLEALVRRLRRYNEWRRGADFEQPEPTGIGADIDAAIELLELMCNGKWQLVCASPNKDMISFAEGVVRNTYSDMDRLQSSLCVERVWATMLARSPRPYSA